MKTRWVRIAVYNIKLSLYERKRHKSLKKEKKKVYTLLKEMTGVNLRYPGFLISFKYSFRYGFTPRLWSVSHYSFSADRRIEMWFQSVLHPHRWTQVQTPQSVWVIWIINPYLGLAQRLKKLSSLEKNVFLLRQDRNLFGHNSSKKTIMRYLNKRKISGTCERRNQDEVDE